MVPHGGADDPRGPKKGVPVAAAGPARVKCAVCELVELPRAVVGSDRRPCTCGGTIWYEAPPCAHDGMRLVVRAGRQEGWCPTCGWSQGGERFSVDERTTREEHTPNHTLLPESVTCTHPMRGSWCVQCGAVRDETPTRGYAGPVWELPVDAQRRTNLRANASERKDTIIAADKRSAAPQADAQRKAFVRVRPMLPPIGEGAPVCFECGAKASTHRCTFFAPNETSILCGRWLCQPHAHNAFEGGAVLCAEHLPMAKALLVRRAEKT